MKLDIFYRKLVLIWLSLVKMGVILENCFNRNYNIPLWILETSAIHCLFWVLFCFLLVNWTGSWILLMTWNPWEPKLPFSWASQLQTADRWCDINFRDCHNSSCLNHLSNWCCVSPTESLPEYLMTSSETFQTTKDVSGLQTQKLVYNFLWSLTFTFLFP